MIIGSAAVTRHPTTLYAVRSDKQRKLKNGQYFMSASLGRAVTEATIAAKRKKQRMYVVIIKRY